MSQLKYPPESYQRLYNPSVGTLWTAAAGLPPDEDGDHYSPEPNFFEWWYFDATFDNGYKLVAIIHSSLFNAADHKPTLDLRVYPPRGERVLAVRRFKRDEFGSRRDRCDLQLGDCRVTTDGNTYHLILREGDIEADLLFTPQLPAWRPGTGYLFFDASSGQYFKWVVPLPAATVSGALKVQDASFAVQGAGYHDHNWGNLYLPAAFSRWTWGRMLTKNGTVIFGDVVGQGTISHVTPFILAYHNEIVLESERVNIRRKELVREPRTGVKYHRRLHLNTLKGLTVELTLTAGRLIEALDFAAPHLPLAGHRSLRGAAELAFYLSQSVPFAGRLAAWALGKGSYLRLEGDYHLCLPEHNIEETGQALYEVMVL